MNNGIQKMIRLTLILFTLLFLCPLHANTISKNDTFVSDVIDVQEEMLYSGYWTSKISNGDSKLLTAEQIDSDNKRLFKVNDPMTALVEFPDSLSASKIVEIIQKISSVPSTHRYYSDGKEVTKANYNRYKYALDVTAVPSQQPIRFGMVVRRTNMRTFPTSDRVYKTSTSTNLDRFQETALFPTEVVAILHESLDKQWYFGVSYNYSAWFKKVDIAIGEPEEIFAYKKNKDFLVVTGSKIFTTFNSDNKNISEIQLEMGTVLPLVKADNIPVSIGGQNTYSSHVISLPVRDSGGKLVFQAALISRNSDIHQGFLPYTKNNIIKQSFKFLGERYGWGHSFNARDCTGFVGEVFKSFGILMPRNSGEQGHSEQGKNAQFLKTASKSEKLNFIKELSVGDLIYRPGHVMMFLGFDEDKPFIIHDVSELKYFKNNGEFYSSLLNGVSITPLLPLQLSEDKSYVDKIYNIKKIQ